MNWNLIGHQWAVNLLHKHLADNNLRHAYLITGPDGIGRRLLALRLTQALFCESPPSEGVPCYHCRTCQQIEREEHPDLYTIQVEEGTQVIKIDQIRDLQHALSLSPYEQQFQIGILQEFEKANPSAQNALLKTLEEPPPRVVLILTAESGEQLLETITSRCEGIDLRPVPRKTIQRELQQRRELSTERARTLAHIAQGRPGYALRLLDNPELFEQRQAWLDEHQELLPATIVQRFAYAERFKNDAQTFQKILHTWITLWRDIMLTSAGSTSALTNIDRQKDIERIAARIDTHTSQQMVSNLEHAAFLLQRYANTQLTIENLLLQLPTL
mgnify:CR=1 FL=1